MLGFGPISGAAISANSASSGGGGGPPPPPPTVRSNAVSVITGALAFLAVLFR